MNRFIAAINRKWRSNVLSVVFNPKDERGRGRLCMLSSAIMASIASNLSGGLFYTGFLLAYGFDITSIAFITFIPTIASLLNMFSPWILEHFKRRKFILAGGKLLYYTINIGGVTLLPVLVTDHDALLVCFIAVVIAANAVNALFSSGYSAWQANFLPDNIRMSYFTATGCINSLFSYIIIFLVSLLTDSLAGTPNQLSMLILIRWIAFGLGVLDCLINLIPKEYPYLSQAKVKISNIFVLPFRNHRFLFTILIVAAYNFAANLPNATINTYVLEIGISYSLVNGINALYFLFFIFFSKMWSKFVARHYWFRAFALAMLMQAVTYYAYAFVTADTVWLYVVVRLTQHVFGVIMNSIVSSLPYVNLPEADRTNYLAFHTIVYTLASFTSMWAGTGFTKFMGTNVLTVFGFAFSSTQILLFACAVAQCLVAIMSWCLSKPLTPPEARVQNAA